MVRWLALALAALGSTACLDSSSVVCANGRLCPAGRVCDDVHDTCVLPEQLDACDGLGQLDPCSIRGEQVGLCQEGVCIEEGCGDGLVTGTEECDGDDLGELTDCLDLDFHDSAPLSCTPLCTWNVESCARRCGDGVVDRPEEQCDAAPDVAVGECTDHGFYEGGAFTCSGSCAYDFSVCDRRCGDGVHDPEEVCDGTIPTVECLELGFEAGRTTCSPLCAPDVTACRDIGWSLAVPIDLGVWTAIWMDPNGEAIVAGRFGVAHVDGAEVTPRGVGSGFLNDVWGSSAGDVFAVNDAGGIWRWNGSTWSASQAETGMAEDALEGVSGRSSQDVWAVGARERILHFDGMDWTEVHVSLDVSPRLMDVWASAPGPGQVVYAVGEDGTVLRDTGGGWTPVAAAPATYQLQAVWGSSPDDVYVAGADESSDGALLHFDGEIWREIDIATGRLFDLWGRSSDDVFAVGDGGVVLRYDGESWWRLAAGTTQNFKGVAGNESDVMVAALEDPVLRHEGASWTLEPIADTMDRIATGGGALLAVDVNTALARGEAGWVALDPLSFVDGWVAPDGELFVVDGADVVRRWNGVDWIALPGTAGAGVHALGGSAGDDLWTVDGNGDAGHWNGAVWTILDTDGDPEAFPYYNAVSATSPTDAFAVGESQQSVIRHYDGAWSDMPHADVGTLFDVWTRAPDDVWAVGEAGAILHYDGVEWAQVPSGVTAALLGVHGSSADDVWAVGSASTILHYDGEAWSQVLAPIEAVFTGVAVGPRVVAFSTSNNEEGLVALIRDEAW